MTRIHITPDGDLIPLTDAVKRRLRDRAIKALVQPMLVTLPPVPEWSPSEGGAQEACRG